MSRYYVGLDVHKAGICVAVLNAAGRLVMEAADRVLALLREHEAPRFVARRAALEQPVAFSPQVGLDGEICPQSKVTARRQKAG